VTSHGDSIEQVIRLISHDLCNPLTAVQLNAQLIEQSAARGGHDKEQRWATLIAEAARRMNDMLQRLVEAERIRSGRISLALEPVPLGGLVRDIVSRGEGGINADRVRMTIPEDVFLVKADKRRVSQTFGALLGLALQECSETLAVEVAASVGGTEVLCAIRPPAEASAQSANEARRPEAGRANQGGDAIALHYARTLIECHGGRLAVEKRGDAAVAFEVALPLAAAVAKEARI
jgi:two-component system sensor histidine kinase KdpD